MITATQTKSDASLSHYGIKGMRWGVRKTQKDSKKSNAKKTKSMSQTRKARLKRAAKFLGTSAILTVAVNSMLKSNQGTIHNGKQAVNSFMKQSGKKKISDCDKSWADYAWDEVQKSGWG